MSDYVPTEDEERAFSDAMDADRMPSATVDYWVYAAAIEARDAALRLAEEREQERGRLHNAGGLLYCEVLLLRGGAPSEDKGKASCEQWVRAIESLAAAPPAGEATGRAE